jgi:hypothetical protein
MSKHIFTYGAIGGVIVVILMFAGQSLMIGPDGQMNFDLGETLGYVSMIISLSVIFFGIKSYRDNQLNGMITFGNAFKIGILITLVASLFYVVGWMVYYQTSDNAAGFLEQYTEHAVAKMEANGKSLAEIEQFKKDSLEFAEMYKNPFVRAGVTLVEIFPVGFLISLLSAFILKQKIDS